MHLSVSQLWDIQPSRGRVASIPVFVAEGFGEPLPVVFKRLVNVGGPRSSRRLLNCCKVAVDRTGLVLCLAWEVLCSVSVSQN